MFKNLLRVLLVLLLPVQLFSQVVTTSPAFPTENQSVTIIFHATEGDAGLADFTGDIWAHTGVITDNSSSGSDWKYVVAGWGENTDKAKLSRIDANTYELQIAPSIREYYGVPEGEQIQKIAIVFRNSDGSKTGRDAGGLDIFTDVYEAGLNVDIESPLSGEIVEMNAHVPVVVNASDALSLHFYINDAFIGEYPAEGFTYDYVASDAGKTSFKVEAIGVDDTIADSSYVFVRGDVTVEELPAGMHDGLNYLSDHSVLFSLLAPGKSYAFVIGDFNNWEVDDASYMKQTPDGERFWVQIDNLEAGIPYIYQYYIDGELKVADVYSEQVSDPWNDSYIPEDIFPNMPEYPFGKTQGIASVFTIGEDTYQWQTTDYQPPKVTDMVIYEVLVRDISSEHSFQFLIDTLSYFKNLGINTIELMPINEFEGNSSWGYNPSFYFAVDKYYGTKNKLKEFIDLCHANGMAVVIDMVLNHSYGQNPQVQMYWDGANNQPAANNPWFNQQSPNPDFSWGSDYNHESVYTQHFVDQVTSFWLSEFKVDGFRFDFTKGFTNTYGNGWAYDASRIAILQRMANTIWTVNPNAYVILEHLTDNSEEKVLSNSGMLLWGNMNSKYKEANMGYNGGDKSDLSWASYKKRGWTSPHVVAYMESHDEERQMVFNNTWGNHNGWYDITEESIGLKRIGLTTLFHLMIPGPKMFWEFEELGYDYSINWPSGTGNDRLTPKPPKWEYQSEWRRKYLHDLTAALNKLKTTQDAWETDHFQIDVYGAIKTVKLLSDQMNVVAVGNFDVIPRDIEVEFPSIGTWYNYFDGQTIEIGSDGKWNTTISQGNFYLLTSVPLENPQLGTGISPVITENKALSIYPNPVSNQLTVLLNSGAKGQIFVKILDINGHEVYSQYAYGLTDSWQDSIPSGNLESGVYILQIQTESTLNSLKFVKM
jgi:1,4-alpha-glucan branching enzyme